MPDTRRIKSDQSAKGRITARAHKPPRAKRWPQAAQAIQLSFCGFVDIQCPCGVSQQAKKRNEVARTLPCE
jgi:hypothetical protein